MKRMVDNLRHHLKVYKIFLKASIMTRMEYRGDYLLSLFVLFLNMFFIIIFAKIIYGHLNSIAGWDFNHLLIVIASYMFIDGFSWLTFRHFNLINRYIRNGDFDFFMTKPIDTQFLTAVYKVDTEDTARIITGLFLIYLALKNITVTNLWLNLLVYILLLINSLVIFFSVIVFLKTISFWVIHSDGVNGIVHKFIDISQYPTDIYRGAARWIFTLVLPVVFIATVPAKIFVGWYDWRMIFGSFAIAGIFFYLSRRWWLFGLKHYSSASS